LLLLLPAAKDMASSVLEVKVAKQFELNPLCHATTSQISNMASNDKLQLIEKVKDNRYFSIQINESNVVGNVAYLLTFISEDEDSVKEELSLCKPLLGHITSKNI
jgi:uncharacterized protein YbcC (UPF0753/DUF2309 family)